MQSIQVNNFSVDDKVKAVFRKRRLRVKKHIHQFAEFIYVMEGEFIVKHNAINEIARAGDIVVVPPFQEHGYHGEDNVKTHCWMVLFSDTFIQDIVHHESAYFEFKNIVFTPSNELKAFIESRMFETNSGHESIELDFKSNLSLKSLIYGVFSEYFKANSQTLKNNASANEQKTASSLVESVVRYMKLNFRNDISIENCSKEIGYSVSHISHNLSKHLHITFLQLRNSLRINYAQHLLRFSKMSVQMIGFECGFNSEKTFERVFKQLIGMTPQQFRKPHSKKNNKEAPLQK